VVGEVRSVISESSHPIKELFPTPLTEPEIAKILESRGWVPEILQSLELKRCLADLGGVPLVLETFVREVEEEHPNISQQAVQLPYGAIRDRTMDYMMKNFHPAFIEQVPRLQDLVFRVLWSREAFYLRSSFVDVTVDDLQRSGILSLGEDRRIRMPVMYLVRERA